MALPPALCPRLQHLFLLLTSDVEGERLAGHCRDRPLKANNCTWHDLVDGLADPTPPPPAVAAPVPNLRPHGDGRFEINADELLPLVQAVRERVYFDAWTDEFLTGMETRACHWSVVLLSERQATVLIKLIERIPA